MNYHIPVLAENCVQTLDPHPGGVYVDATLGGGGHAKALLERCPQITLYGFDADSEALAEARNKLSDAAGVEYVHANFSRLRTELALRKVKAIDGILFDLGVSSHQLDTPARGFSFDREAPLDMRMDARIAQTAADVLNEATERELAGIFRSYGEEPSAGRIAREIVRQRGEKPIQTTKDLARIIDKVYPAGTRDALKAKVRVFQSLRIRVNRELEVLEPALRDAINILRPGGRIVVISYHSLEDRIVKTTFLEAAAGCVCPPRIPLCVCGRKKQLRLLQRKPVSPGPEETAANPRSRSARLRAAEKLMGES
jgi:16S rRNA (cytosine1402-N4)-methyltransferase